MRLITKTLLYYLSVSLPLLAIAGYVSYSLVKNEIRDSTDEYLWKENLNAQKIIQTHSIQDVYYLTTDSLSKIIPVTIAEKGHSYGDTKLYDRFEEEVLDYRVLKQYCQFNGQNYLITIYKSTLENDDLIESLLKSFILIIGFLLLVFFGLNWILSKTLWKPFYYSLSVLNSYDVKKHNLIKLEEVSTKEFKQLNNTLNVLIKKIHTDYINQKEFIENASHEMQTPLAVIKAYVNLLMQSDKLGESEINGLQGIDDTLKKLATLNKSLLLLSKIENDQFSDKAKIHLNAVVAKCLDNFKVISDLKNIKINYLTFEDVYLNMNLVLAEVLVMNLIQNAIRHNVDEQGTINVEIRDNYFKISNTGPSMKLQISDLAKRFNKNSMSKDSLGLGLSIINSIVKLYDFKLEYNYQDSHHSFIIKFS